MSYSHMFYGVDLTRLKAVYGSKDERLIADVLKERAEELQNNDGFFEDELEAGTIPNSEAALREIVAGTIRKYEGAEPLFGYVLKILCEHIGEFIGGGEVAAIRDHSYKSQLLASGVPIPIPYTGQNFPEIGFLASHEIPAELQRIDRAPPKAKRSFKMTLLSWLTRGLIGRQMSDAEAVEDMQAYRATLQAALDKGLSVVSFRH
ncbi:MAG: hypothetical protein ACKV2Q_33615 [Planctomycetaceae bacterium]